MIDIFSAGLRVRGVQFVMWLSLAAAAWALWLGWDLAHTYGLQPGDGGKLAPFGVRLAWGLGIAGLGVAFMAGMWLYGRISVWAVGYNEAENRLYFRTLSFFGSRLSSFQVSSVTRTTYVGGNFFLPGEPTVQAPWYNVWIAGRRLPLILDGKGQFGDPKLVSKVLGVRIRGAR